MDKTSFYVLGKALSGELSITWGGRVVSHAFISYRVNSLKKKTIVSCQN